MYFSIASRICCGVPGICPSKTGTEFRFRYRVLRINYIMFNYWIAYVVIYY